jgi:hypothetical protein
MPWLIDMDPIDLGSIHLGWIHLGATSKPYTCNTNRPT